MPFQVVMDVTDKNGMERTITSVFQGRSLERVYERRFNPVAKIQLAELEEGMVVRDLRIELRNDLYVGSHPFVGRQRVGDVKPESALPIWPGKEIPVEIGYSTFTEAKHYEDEDPFDV